MKEWPPWLQGDGVIPRNQIDLEIRDSDDAVTACLCVLNNAQATTKGLWDNALDFPTG